MTLSLFNRDWYRSSRSGENGGNCVEVCALESFVAVRDSKLPELGALVFSRQEWSEFVTATKIGEFDARQ
ncbi:MAG: hypothetical protein V7603_1897 [Micromonosporaceae bacterium]